MNLDDLDAMGESVPFAKETLDNLLGVQSNEESYRHYFNCFPEAQRIRVVQNDASGRPNMGDSLKKNVQQWNYQDFLRAQVASHIPQVKEINAQLSRIMLGEMEGNTL
jgi:hypothetical protein